MLIAWLLARHAWSLLGTSGLLPASAPLVLNVADPFWLAFAPYWSPGSVHAGDYVAFIAGTLAVSVVLVVLSVLRVRVVYVRQAGWPPRAERRMSGLGKVLARERWLSWLPSPSLDGNPVLWREWHRSQPSRWARVIWVVYGLAATLFTAVAVVLALQEARGPGPPAWGSIMAVFVSGFEVGIGLLLVSVSASTVLAEERARGTLDALLSTPLSTPTIVWGKWWGAFRKVPLLALFPGVIALAFAVGHPTRPAGVLFVVGLFLANGAAIASLGLALATWIERLGRAIAACVAIYVVVSIAWFFFVVLVFQNDAVVGPGLAGASPWWSAIYHTVCILDDNAFQSKSTAAIWGLIWLITYLGAAWALLVATLVTFDRSLGRMPEHRLLPRLGRRDPIGPVRVLVEADAS